MWMGQDRDSMRRYYCDVWERAQAGEMLDPMQAMIAEVVREHPEYQALITDTDKALGREFLPEGGETNPFLHMGLHLAIREQLQTDLPPGIRSEYQRLANKAGDAHTAEHQIMECLAQALWAAQSGGGQPDEKAYLACVKTL